VNAVVLYCFVFVVSVEVARRLSLPVVDVGVIISMILLCLSHVGWLLNKKAARRGVNISLAILHWEEIVLHSWLFVPDMVISG